ncbi:MAG: UDP-N-acetylmuramoyl-L-alanyl-D-glutamate--2,6-diaminopimelate ligase [Hyphomicrobiales bacterium]|nr:UDP-N-acetylmuramoyl-L-alanyl-D-glutamate--2,6-diaminopimelate ligase [Hyphomicrobiales bacterium]
MTFEKRDIISRLLTRTDELGTSALPEITGLTADSRLVEPGYLFAALSGTKTDGGRYIEEAILRGAIAVLVSDEQMVNVPLQIQVIRDTNPRQCLAKLAASFYGAQPKLTVAVTGTNGKTSVASFLRQIWEHAGLKAASLGTTGISFKGQEEILAHTTPDPVVLHEKLASLTERGATHLAFEASSHGLAQYRLDGVQLKAGAFTNISRDHMDYHADFEDYFNAKMRLFTELLPLGSPAVIDVDSEAGVKAAGIARDHGLEVFTVGHNGETLRLDAVERQGFGQRLKLSYRGKRREILLPLAGDFQASNGLVALGLALATGLDADKAFAAAEKLTGAKGRLELAGRTKTGDPVFIDYAHTHAALENALTALRPYAKKRLHVVFGAGGDRDKGKRPMMGEAAMRLADCVYVTDDNPRGEEPAMISARIVAAAAGAREIGDRREAIAVAIAAMEPGDLLLVAGKGHETGQIVGDRVLPYSDHEAVMSILGGVEG